MLPKRTTLRSVWHRKSVTQDRRPCTLKVIAGVDADYNETTAFGAAAVFDDTSRSLGNGNREMSR
jgi:hypothetical protein